MPRRPKEDLMETARFRAHRNPNNRDWKLNLTEQRVRRLEPGGRRTAEAIDGLRDWIGGQGNNHAPGGAKLHFSDLQREQGRDRVKPRLPRSIVRTRRGSRQANFVPLSGSRIHGHNFRVQVVCEGNSGEQKRNGASDCNCFRENPGIGISPRT